MLFRRRQAFRRQSSCGFLEPERRLRAVVSVSLCSQLARLEEPLLFPQEAEGFRDAAGTPRRDLQERAVPRSGGFHRSDRAVQVGQRESQRPRRIHQRSDQVPGRVQRSQGPRHLQDAVRSVSEGQVPSEKPDPSRVSALSLPPGLRSSSARRNGIQ